MLYFRRELVTLWSNGAMTNLANDVASAWPSKGTPIIATALFESSLALKDIREADEAVLAEVGTAACRWSTCARP
jgi:beta-lactamase class A